MTEYFVAGGIYTNPMGREKFDLVVEEPGKPPFVMANGVMAYFRLIWENAHLYRVNPDYSLSLVAASPKALERGIKAPEVVTPDSSLRAKLRNLAKLSPTPHSADLPSK